MKYQRNALLTIFFEDKSDKSINSLYLDTLVTKRKGLKFAVKIYIINKFYLFI